MIEEHASVPAGVAPAAEQQRAEQQRAEQQRDNLCGPFHAARVLVESGFPEWRGEPIDQDLVALHAGTALPEVPRGPQVPPGAVSLLDYRHRLPLVESERSGTTAPGLGDAIALLSEGALECVPLRGRWSAENVQRLLDGVSAVPARLIANVRTGLLWSSRPPLEVLLAALEGAAPDDVPSAEWDVGHFVELVQLLRGRGGELVLVRDSYPSLGWNGHHLQPPSAIADALNRGDGRGGGVLAVVPASHARDVRDLAVRLALETEMWEN